MEIMIRRSPVTTDAESEETLAEAMNVAHVHTLLYQHGESGLADRLTAHLRPEEARALATDLRRYIHKAARPSMFRDYRTLLRAADAQAIGIVAAWYARVGMAGCRSWADLRDQVTGAAPMPTLLLPTTDGAPPLADAPTAADEHDSAATAPTGEGIMPAWLSAPATSVWRR